MMPLDLHSSDLPALFDVQVLPIRCDACAHVGTALKSAWSICSMVCFGCFSIFVIVPPRKFVTVSLYCCPKARTDGCFGAVRSVGIPAQCCRLIGHSLFEIAESARRRHQGGKPEQRITICIHDYPCTADAK